MDRTRRSMTMRDADVLIAGAGPTGLTLAGELALNARKRGSRR